MPRNNRLKIDASATVVALILTGLLTSGDDNPVSNAAAKADKAPAAPIVMNAADGQKQFSPAVNVAPNTTVVERVSR
ncbi:MAG: hypothetical protein AAF638_06440 [Pseudomonadota bacterium]